MSLFGRIIGDPFADYSGATVTDDVAISDTVIPVDDVSDFDEDAAVNGGVLIVGVEIDADGLIDQSSATRLPYDTFDEDAGTVTLTAPSPVAIDSGDFVWVLDDVADEPLVDLTVWVEVEGADQDGDPLPALVAHELIGAVTTSDVEGLPVELVVDEDDQLVARPVGGSKAGKGGDGSPVKFYQDELAVTSVGEQTLQLTYRPIVNSEHLYVGGVYQRESQWSRDGWTVTIPDPGGFAKIGTRVVMEYAYLDPTPRPVIPATLEFVGIRTTATENAPFLGVPIPVDAEEGDLLVFSGSSFAPNGAWTLDNGSGPDARIRQFLSDVNPPPGMNGSTPGGMVCAGYAIEDGSGDPLLIGQGGIADDVVTVAAFRYTAGVIAVLWTEMQDAATPIPNEYHPAIPAGDPQVVVACLQGQRGTVSEGFHVDPLGNYVSVADTQDAHLGLARAHISYSPVGGLGVWTGLSNPSIWSALMIGLYDG